MRYPYFHRHEREFTHYILGFCRRIPINSFSSEGITDRLESRTQTSSSTKVEYLLSLEMTKEFYGCSSMTLQVSVLSRTWAPQSFSHLSRASSTDIASHAGQRLLCRTEYHAGSESIATMLFAKHAPNEDPKQNGILFGAPSSLCISAFRLALTSDTVRS